MIKTIIRVMYSSFISIVLVSIVFAGWTAYSFVFQSSKSIELANVLQDMYSSQKSVFVDVIDLSKILIKDPGNNITNRNEDLFLETELLADKEEDSPFDQPPITEDNGNNPLGLVIQRSSSEVNEDRLPERIEEPLVNEKNELSMNEMEFELK